MEQRKRQLTHRKKQKRIIGSIVLLALIAGVVLFLNRKPDYYNGIHVRFEEEASAEQEQLVLAQYDTAVLLDADDPILHDYTLAFPNQSEREVKKMVASLCKSDAVREASYVRVVSLTRELEASGPLTSG